MDDPAKIKATGAYHLGVNQQHGGSGTFLHAGARAELIDSPVTRALSTFTGRMAAQTVRYMLRGRVAPIMHYVALRPFAGNHAVRVALGENPDGKTVLDPAGGFSPAYYWLAEELPNTQFIEIDTASTVEKKLESLQSLGIPRNLHLQAADLSQEALHEAHKGRIDVLQTNGAYLTHAEFAEMLAYLGQIVTHGGYLVSAFPYRPGIENFTDNSMVFSQVVTTPQGYVDNAEDLHRIFEGSPFTITEIMHFGDLAEQMNRPVTADIEVMVVARRD